ncbi:MAG: flavin reductase family protein [Anaerolineales bacterium]|nr:flavin reductase family protein [Anaerolineales bacterium]
MSAAFSPRDFRNTLGRFATGVTIITTEHEGRTHGMTANAFVSVSLDPPLVLVSIDNRANIHRLLPVTGRYGVSILAEGQEKHSNHFAGRRVEGLTVNFIRKHEMPLIEGALAHLVCRVVEAHPGGDHTLYIGQVEYLDWRDGRPLVFFSGQYRGLDIERIQPTPWPEDELSLFVIHTI